MARRKDMKSRLLLVGVLVAVSLTTYAGTVLATPSSGFAGITLAKATFGNCDMQRSAAQHFDALKRLLDRDEADYAR